MDKVQFIFGIHNHQPVGNFDNVFHYAADRSYLPFLQVLEKFPNISMAFHFSGSLIEWLEVHRPEVLALLKKLVQRGNVEILGAGFYEPILAMIPEPDRIGQIEKMNQWAHKNLDYEIKGNWLTERVWEPHLAQTLKKAHIDYTIVDDYHFLASGVDPEQLNGYYQTEQDGHFLGVFPISQKLRYAMPFEDPQVTIDKLREQATAAGDNVIVMADDGEKFGIWPGTWDSVYGEKWLERFFSLLEANSEWLKTTTFKEYFNEHGPRDLVYLPTSSYFEMSQWTLRTNLGQRMDRLIHDLEARGTIEANRPFIKGGMWRNFFTKYPESNWMQKRVQNLSLNLIQLESKGGAPQTLLDDVYRAQCNCGYWHGVFGGLYLPHLRHALYEHLLKAEASFVELGGTFAGLADIDGDGHEEYRLRSNDIQLFVSAKEGHIREIDCLSANFNVTNYVQRYAESYHHKLAHANRENTGGGSIHDLVLTKEEGLQDKLFTDTYSRHSLVDHLFGDEHDQNSYYCGLMADRNDTAKVEQAEAGVKMQAQRAIDGTQLTIEKSLSLHHNTLSIKLAIKNTGKERFVRNYGLEFNFGLLGGETPDRYYLLNGKHGGYLNSHGKDGGISQLSLIDEWDNFKIDLNFTDVSQLWRAPIETISMSEAGFERVYQASSILPHWHLTLNPGEVFNTEITICIDKYK
ncbi:MAG: DUF1926 domain-containing protein [Candidatus Marinimicrobia bacterium]|nr:DUF1926 domain-containing protein [Candidatus Neomarinimicrobiota bacterium]